MISVKSGVFIRRRHFSFFLMFNLELDADRCRVNRVNWLGTVTKNVG